MKKESLKCFPRLNDKHWIYLMVCFVYFLKVEQYTCHLHIGQFWIFGERILYRISTSVHHGPCYLGLMIESIGQVWGSSGLDAPDQREALMCLIRERNMGPLIPIMWLRMDMRHHAFVFMFSFRLGLLSLGLGFFAVTPCLLIYTPLFL